MEHKILDRLRLKQDIVTKVRLFEDLDIEVRGGSLIEEMSMPGDDCPFLR